MAKKKKAKKKARVKTKKAICPKGSGFKAKAACSGFRPRAD